MGYSDFGSHYPYYAADNYTKEHLVSKASDDVPIGIFSECGAADYRHNSPLHVLRCFYFKPHENDTILECDPLPVYLDYKTKVRLVSDHYPSSGTLEILIDSTWGNVCNTKFNQQAADSVCRQMGYTNALAFNSTKPSQLPWSGLTEWNAAQSRANASTAVSKLRTPMPLAQEGSTSPSTAHLMSRFLQAIGAPT